ncbi:MAG: type II secretion system protein [Patescibacteria group bacterium]
MWWNQFRNLKDDRGSTLIELVIAIMVAGVILVAVAIGIMSSIQQTASARYREIGTTLAQEGIEVFYKERAKLGWQNFVTTYIGVDYCVNEDTKAIESPPCVVITQLSHDFNRSILVANNGTVIDVGVTVEWTAGRNKPDPTDPNSQPSVTFSQKFAQTY